MSLIVGLIGGVLLNAFYLAVKHVWPANYFSIDSGTEYSIARDPIRFVAFRLLPPMLAVAAAGDITDGYAGIEWVTWVAVMAIHGSRLVRALVSDVEERASSMIAWHACLLVAVVGTSALASRFRRLVAAFVPSPHDIATSLWTAILAAVIAVYLQRVALGKTSARDGTLRTLRRMRPNLYRAIVSTAEADEYPPLVLLALAVTEAMQRPTWFRFLEDRLPGRVTRTTGIFQQVGARDDLHSLELARTRIFDTAALDQAGPLEPTEFLQKCAKLQNPSPEFHGLLVDVYNILTSDDRAIQRCLRKLEDSAPEDSKLV